ncbi:hypothetical protein CSA37_00160 [Candidatus Fermentibacteria bacterium]|nr:MAG: hypothetical protein CSA37_00160 [Candidatus Fermentibacteria bacterium]
MSKVEYYRPDETHIDDIYRIEQECFPEPWDIEEIASLITVAPGLYTLAAFIRCKPAGYISATFSAPKELHIISLGVKPEYRRRGIASDLLSCAVQWGRHMGALKVLLEVREYNEDAIAFYRACGFNSSGFLNNFYGDRQNGLSMELETDSINGTLDTVLYLNGVLPAAPVLGVILGSGLGWVTEPFGEGFSIPFENIPGMSGGAVKGHAHRMHLSSDGRIVFVMGRRHHYQGYEGRDIVLLPAALACLGVDRWLLTSSSGAVDPGYRTGDAMVFTNHVNYSGCIPDPPLFPTGHDIYSDSFRKMVREEMPECRSGIFACVSGPAYETAAEVALIRSNGCSAVSMSTAQEAMALRALGCRVSAISLITNAVESGESVCHEEVLSAQQILREKQETGLINLVERLSGELR